MFLNMFVDRIIFTKELSKKLSLLKMKSNRRVFWILLWNFLLLDITNSISTREISSVDNLKLDKGDKITQLTFSAFGNGYNFDLIPSEIFSPNFQIISDDLEKESLDGKFYTTKNGLGSVYIESNKDSISVHGMINENLYFYTLDNVQMIRRENSLKKREILKSETSNEDENSSKVVVEVLVLLDETALLKLRTSKMPMTVYLGIYWNSVQRRYNEITNPRIEFVITGVSILKVRKEMGKAFRPRNLLNAHIVLGLLSKWLYNESHRLPNFDIAVLQTGLDLTNTSWHVLEKGRSYTSSLCNIDHKEKSILSCGVSEDEPPNFTGVLTTAHEIAHIFGAEHDGQQSDGQCSDKDGYLMSTLVSHSDHSWQFSPCTINTIKNFISKASCVKSETVQSKYKILDILPGKGLTLKDVCNKWFGSPYIPMFMSEHKNPCTSLNCHAFGDWKTKGPPPEGTTCDKNKICKNGHCVDDDSDVSKH